MVRSIPSHLRVICWAPQSVLQSRLRSLAELLQSTSQPRASASRWYKETLWQSEKLVRLRDSRMYSVDGVSTPSTTPELRVMLLELENFLIRSSSVSRILFSPFWISLERLRVTTMEYPIP